jgi:hypothetical protein
MGPAQRVLDLQGAFAEPDSAERPEVENSGRPDTRNDAS